MARRIDPRQPNRLASQPATVLSCALDRRSEGEQRIAEGMARDQLAFTRMAASGDTPLAEPDDR
ncbi:hypothetical protein [Streptomyces chartreusis]|uniref:hypothetical protein n=1 Tax=Streptomyces chartreusis TaxID=1969 RepID=UPI0033CE540F